MATLKDIKDFLNSFAPPHLAEDYDNVGLLIGDETKEVSKILVTLDADISVSKEAKEKGAQLIVSHHPLIFKPLYCITNEDSVAKTAISLIKDDIALISVHTNFDSVKSGLNDLFLDKIATTKNRTTIEGDGENGIGRVAELKQETTLGVLLANLKETFSLENIRYVGDENKTIKTIAAVNGGGADFVYQAKDLGADCYISGDIKYHHARFSYENDLALVEIPHYAAEKIFCDYVKSLLEEAFCGSVEVLVSEKNIDVWKQI